MCAFVDKHLVGLLVRPRGSSRNQKQLLARLLNAPQKEVHSHKNKKELFYESQPS